jgi:hypothetical protein
MARTAWLAPFLLALGCREARTEPAVQQKAPAAPAPSQFNVATAGAIGGKVVWSGELLNIPAFEIRSLVTAWSPAHTRLVRENPHAPVIDPASKGVAGAVVFLRGVDARQARPWDHPPVVVEHHDRRLFVVQGTSRSRVGFVRQGDAITMVSRENVFNALRASGAAFFSLMFPDPDQPLQRHLMDKGLVELASSAGYYWMRGYLFVDDHPYYASTDAQGNFTLPQVPAGRYQVVCWMPNWNKTRQDRDPESGLVTRITFHPALEQEREVVVVAGVEAPVHFTIQATMFKR